jgi:hypothetical protein
MRKCFGTMDCYITGNCDNCNDYKECFTKSFEIDHHKEEMMIKK